MGYTTTFTGVLEFDCDISAEMLALVKSLEAVDLREVDPEYHKKHDVYYIQWRLSDDFKGIEWDGGEKFYGAVGAVNWLVSRVRENFPHFQLKGQMAAQGEDVEDRWILKMRKGKAVRIDDPPTGRRVECPDCGAGFYVDGDGK